MHLSTQESDNVYTCASWSAMCAARAKRSSRSDQSFIADGPVRKIRNVNEELVQSYTWNPEQLNSPATKREFGEVAKDLTEILEKRDAARPMQLRPLVVPTPDPVGQ